jgi:hypothetical protein
MSSYQGDRICDRCGKEYIYSFDCKTGEEEQITCCGCDKKESKMKNDLKKYKKGFNILYEYFDSISDEEKPKVDKKLKRLGL